MSSPPFLSRLLSAIAAMVGSPALAADATLALPDLLVTATRTPVAEARVLADATVIDRAEIERRQPLTVPDLLRGQRGLAVASAGGAGKQTSVFLRGTNAKDALVLINGVRAGSATAGTFAWEFLPVSEVERIEIVRGPRSSLYGADAVGGVIQVFTRRPEDEGTAYTARAGAGGRDTFLAEAGVSGGNGQSGAGVHGSWLATDGSNARDPTVVFGLPLDEPDRDGYRNRALSGRLSHRFGPAAGVSVDLLQSEGTTEYDGFPFDTNETEFTQQILGARVDLQPLDGWRSLVTAGRSLDRRRERRDGGAVPSARFDTESLSLSWQNDVTLGPGLLTLGADRLDQRVDSSVEYERTSRTVNGAFAELQAALGDHRTVVGGRVDDNGQFGTVATGNLSWAYALGPGWEVLGSYGTAFRAPTFNELYYPDFGNPDLQPERARSLEVGLTGRVGDWASRVSAFRTRVRDLVAFPPPTYVGENVDRAAIDGLELELSGSWGGWEPRLVVTWLDPEDETTGKTLARRPRQSAALDLDRRMGPARLGLTWVVEGGRYDDPGNHDRLGGFGVLDLRARYALGGGWALEARAANVLGKDYQTVAGYPEPGRSVFVAMAYASTGP
ncbi:MAG: TonB-dependent receptor [Gammaproteobacteria bacterium]|nr:TonB-dependent receptor [Gammaproteobacteria bacterium]